MDIQQRSPEGNVKFGFLGIIWEEKRSWGVLFLGFQRAYIQSKIFTLVANMAPFLGYNRYWFHSKPPISSYSENGMYDIIDS